MKKRFSDEQIVGFLREAELGTKTIEQLARVTAQNLMSGHLFLFR